MSLLRLALATYHHPLIWLARVGLIGLRTGCVASLVEVRVFGVGSDNGNDDGCTSQRPAMLPHTLFVCTNTNDLYP